MSIRNLDPLLEPRHVAVIGASARAGSVGATVWRNALAGGLRGGCWPMNPKHTELDGQSCYARVEDLPEAPDLAVVCTPADSVIATIEALGRKGTRAAVVLTAGLSGEAKQTLLQTARRYTLRILGPNCLGLLSPHAGLNASFSHVPAKAGGLAFVSQSGALVTAMLDWAAARGIGFSHVVSLGEHADVDFGDLLDWLAGSSHTRAVLLYIESVEAARKFMSAARAAARNKPVIVVKSGRSALGQAAAASHTGALAASDIVFDAAIRRAGMLRVDTLQQLFNAAETLTHFKGSLAAQVASDLQEEADAAKHPGSASGSLLHRRDRLTIITNGGGAGVMAADAAAEVGVDMAPMTAELKDRLNVFLPPLWSHANPVDIIGDAPVDRYVKTLQALLDDPDSGTVLFMHAPTAIVPSDVIAQALVTELRERLRQHPGRLLACWMGAHAVEAARKTFETAGIACYDTPESAVRAFASLVTYRRNQALLMQAPPARPFGLERAQGLAEVRAIIDRALANGRELLTEPEAKALLAAAGIPMVPTRVAQASAESARTEADAIGYPVTLKILSPQITHKSDVGGVALNLEDAAAVEAAAVAMLDRVKRLRPEAQIEGFSVQAMIRRPRAQELILGSSVDPQFGPVILFGQGGTAVEVLADRAVALPPLNRPLALGLINQTRVAKLLKGWRDVPPAKLDAVADALMALSQLLAEEARIAEIDINPLLADKDGVIALDARVRVQAQATGGAERFAIRPYPTDLVDVLDWHCDELVIRPIRPEDEVQHQAFVAKLASVDMRMRFFHSRREIGQAEMARMTQIDYEREMAFIATRKDLQGQDETLGVSRAICDPDNEEAEFAVVVRSDLKGGGLGELLMRKLVTHLKQRGTRAVVGWVLRENEAMLQLAKNLGFEVDPSEHDIDAVRMKLILANWVAVAPTQAPAA